MPNKHSRYDCSQGCPVEATLELIGGKWKGLLLYHLLEGTQRFSALRRQMLSITPRMLTNQLRELEADGLVHREVFPVIPPHVEYSLTPQGKTLAPVIRELKRWGDAHLARQAGTRRAVA